MKGKCTKNTDPGESETHNVFNRGSISQGFSSRDKQNSYHRNLKDSKNYDKFKYVLITCNRLGIHRKLL